MYHFLPYKKWYVKNVLLLYTADTYIQKKYIYFSYYPLNPFIQMGGGRSVGTWATADFIWKVTGV